MLPRTWLSLCMLCTVVMCGCQPIRPVDITPQPAETQATVPVAAVPSTTTSGAVDCPIVTNQPIDLVILPQWQPGDSRLYRASHKIKRLDHDRDKPTITTSYAMSVTVLEADGDGYIMEWPALAFGPTPRKVRLHYAVSPYGEFIAVRNPAQLNEVVSYLIQQIFFPSGQPVDVDFLEEIPAEAITIATNIATDTLRTYHALYGFYFTNAESYMWDEAVTLPLQSDISGTTHQQVSITRYDADTGCLHVHWESEWEADPPRTGGLGRGTMTGLQLSIVSARRADYVFDLNTGWLQTVTIEVTSIVNGIGQTEHLTLTQVPE